MSTSTASSLIRERAPQPTRHLSHPQLHLARNITSVFLSVGRPVFHSRILRFPSFSTIHISLVGSPVPELLSSHLPVCTLFSGIRVWGQARGTHKTKERGETRTRNIRPIRSLIALRVPFSLFPSPLLSRPPALAGSRVVFHPGLSTVFACSGTAGALWL